MASTHFNAMHKSWLDHVHMVEPTDTTPALRTHDFLENLVNYTATGMSRKEWGVVLQVAGNAGKGERYPLSDLPYVQAVDQITQNMHMTPAQAAQLVSALLHGPLKRHEAIGPILERVADVIFTRDCAASRKAAASMSNYMEHERSPLGRGLRYRKFREQVAAFAFGVS